MNLDKRLLERALSARFSLFLSVALGFLGGILIVWRAFLFSEVVNRVFLNGQVLVDVVSFLLVMLLVFVLMAVVKWAMEVTTTNLATHIKLDIRRALYNHILALGPISISGEYVGEVLSVATEGIDALDAYFQQYLPQLLLSVLIPLTFLFLIFPLDALSAVILLLTAPLIPVFIILIGNIAEVMTKKQWRTLSRLSAHYFDVLQGLNTLKIFGRSREQIEVIAKISEQYRQRTMGVLRVTFLSALVLELVSTLSTAIVAVEVGLRLLYGRLTFEEALFVLLLAPEFYLPLRLLGTRFHAGMAGFEAAKRIFDILDQPVVGDKSLSDNNDRFKAEFRNDELRFHDVYHTYEDSRPSLRGISFDIKPGETVALVGPNGAGKSTIASLLLRFIEPTNGEITLGDQLMADLPSSKIRGLFSWVPQNPYLFNDTVLANIQMARPESTFDEVIDSARRANAHAFIERLPQGYNTVIGEEGSRLSAGEAQRISIARAFLKDTSYLILDEMTSNLDPKNEALIRDAMARLFVGRSVLLIAHRLSTVYEADKIILVNNGQIEAFGSHDELLESSKLYWHMVASYAGSQKLKESIERSHSVPNIPPSRRLSSKEWSRIIEPPQNNSESGVWRTFWSLLDFVKPYSKLVFLSVVLGFATIASGIGLMTTSAYLISAAALKPSIADLQVAIVAVRFFGITRGFFRYLERLVSHQVTFRLLAGLRIWFYQNLEPLAPARIMHYKRGDLINRAIRDINSLENFYVRALSPPLVAILVAICTGLYLWYFSPLMTISLLLFLVGAGLGVPIWTRWLSRGVGEQYIHSRAALSVLLVDGIQGMAELLAFGQERKHLALMIDQDQRLASLQNKMAQIDGRQSALVSLLANMGMWTTLTIGVLLLNLGQIDGVYLASLALAAMVSFEAVMPLPVAAQYLETNLVAGRRLFEIVDVEPEVKDPPYFRIPSEEFDLKICNLWFRYPEGHPSNSTRCHQKNRLEARPYTLEDINLFLPKGKHIAVVGPSGAGKSTIVNLLLRFWDYGKGDILVTGRSLRSLNQEAWRENIGVVSQKTHLFNTTIRENLRIARPDVSDSELIAISKSLQMHDFIQSLPNGYDTWIGERGTRLSGGERRKIEIARAILKDAPLLILDEAFANLDPISERQIFDRLLSLMKERSVLLITHRIVGLDKMDEILVLDQGRVVECGCHNDLLQGQGLYRQMWDIQNQLLYEYKAITDG